MTSHHDAPAGEAPNRLVAGFHHRDHLPHLKREGASYFVVFRLAGTLPAEVLVQLKQERAAIVSQAEAANHPLTWAEQEELFRWYATRVDQYLDAGHGECCCAARTSPIWWRMPSSFTPGNGSICWRGW